MKIGPLEIYHLIIHIVIKSEGETTCIIWQGYKDGYIIMILTFTNKIFDFLMFVPIPVLASARDTGDICRRCVCSNTEL